MSTRSSTALDGYVILPHADLALAHKKTRFESMHKYNMHCIKNISGNENINLEMPSFLWQ
jgi:hypothetical protein